MRAARAGIVDVAFAVRVGASLQHQAAVVAALPEGRADRRLARARLRYHLCLPQTLARIAELEDWPRPYPTMP